MNAEKIGRNDPCICGSSKKYKNCCMNKKHRQSYIEIDAGLAWNIFPNGIIPKGEFELSLPDMNNQMIINKKVVDVKCNLRQSYERKTKKKVLRQIPLDTFKTEYLFDNNSILKMCTNFDLIFAIDTNTITIAEKSFSAALSVVCHAKNDTENQIKVNFFQYKGFEYQNLTPSQAEKNALFDMIISIINNDAYHEKLNIAIVTDFDLKNHDRINKQELPIYNDFFLPINFKFIYASADSGSENFLNKLIKMCDKGATCILNANKSYKQMLLIQDKVQRI